MEAEVGGLKEEKEGRKIVMSFASRPCPEVMIVKRISRDIMF
jgi:hypothetical protein